VIEGIRGSENLLLRYIWTPTNISVCMSVVPLYPYGHSYIRLRIRIGYITLRKHSLRVVETLGRDPISQKLDAIAERALKQL